MRTARIAWGCLVLTTSCVYSDFNVGSGSAGGEAAAGAGGLTSNGGKPSASGGGTAASGGATTGGTVSRGGTASTGGTGTELRVYTWMSSITSTYMIALSVRLCNEGSAAVDVMGMIMDYWLSLDALAGTQQGVNIDYYSGAKMSATVLSVSPARSGMDAKIEFTVAGNSTVAPGSCTLIQTRTSSPTYESGYVQTNDWSFLGQTTYTLNNHVTLYSSTGELIWGIEPPA